MEDYPIPYEPCNARSETEMDQIVSDIIENRMQ